MSTIICTACGYRNIGGSVFCEECGSTLDGVAVATSWTNTAAVVKVATVPTVIEEIVAEPILAPVIAETPAPVEIEHAVTGAAEEVPALTVIPAYIITESGRHLELPAKQVAIIGREDTRSGLRPDIDLTIDGASAAGVSRRHCRLLFENDAWQIEDLMSTNHTFVNGIALEAHAPKVLRDGDDLRLGKLRLQFHHTHRP